MGFVIRWLVAFGLLAATFNPTEWNYTSWVQANFDQQMPLAILLGLLLAAGYIIYLRATLRSIGAFGMGLVLAVVGALLWVLYDYGWLRLDNDAVNVWLAIVALATASTAESFFRGFFS